MSNKYYIDIKDKKIPLVIRSFNNNVFKVYFKNNILNVSKPKHMKYNDMIKNIKTNENDIYDMYCEIMSVENKNMNHWYSGEKLMYKGNLLDVVTVSNNEQYINVDLNLDKNLVKISIPNCVSVEDKKHYTDKAIKDLFKNNTQHLLEQRLPVLSKLTGIEYNSFSVRDATTRYGSCNYNKKKLYFSSRLVMLPIDKVDAIIIHELCHIVHPNHSDNFYNLVKEYKPDYDDCNKWLKDNVKYFNF